MITKRVWAQEGTNGKGSFMREGWYLFGVLPLYVRDMEPSMFRKVR